MSTKFRSCLNVTCLRLSVIVVTRFSYSETRDGVTLEAVGEYALRDPGLR